MLCKECNGKGGFIPYEPGLFNIVCPTCGGYGIIHCCEGDQSQPQDQQQDQSLSQDVVSKEKLY